MVRLCAYAKSPCTTTVRLFSCAKRSCWSRKPLMVKTIVLALCLSVTLLLCLAFNVSDFVSKHERKESVATTSVLTAKHEDTDNAYAINKGYDYGNYSEHIESPIKVIHKLEPRALVLVETPYTKHAQEILVALESSRFRYKVDVSSRSLPNLTHKEKGKYAVVIFEKFEAYLNMDHWNRGLLDKYCQTYRVGILAYTNPTKKLIRAQARGFPLYIQTLLELKDFEVNPESIILNVTKAGQIIHDVPGSDWTGFQSNHSTYSPIAWAYHQPRQSQENQIPGTSHRLATAMLDKGLFDGIQRIIFGNTPQFWPHKILFLDAIRYLSHGLMHITLDRYLQIDIDDIFVAKTGIRMTPDDVQALLDTQERLSQVMPGFKFNLGFSGKYYLSGSEIENQGDKRLIAESQSFWWFGHTWSHAQAHKLNYTGIKQEMLRNKQFAKEHGIPVNTSYAVAPHHSGVFPVHEELYEAWKHVWGVHATSTEEYPHLRPDRKRRGFIYRGIKVLPRQLCGLYTHTIHWDTYPNGPQALKDSVNGGEVFLTFLHVPFMVFMTHLSNYGNDRLALYTFESVIEFVQKWTNLKLRSVEPAELATRYFNMFPLEKDPVWRNPCDDKRHLEIWSNKKSCQRLPDVIILGPQKTGTSALYTFLSMHPVVRRNYNSPTTFEEVQYFNGKNYLEGLDWYLEFFPPVSHNRTKALLFEKSANYFDADLAPMRMSALLPNIRLISILIDPAARAYSWYQHQRYHEIPAALSSTFHEVVTATDRAPKAVRDLRHRCLEPGMYAYHLEKWLDHFTHNNILVIDGDELKNDPVKIMDDVQSFLELQPKMDYALKLKYNSDKGFFCQVVDGDHTKCLGIGKGRAYPPMEQTTVQFLHSYYSKANTALSKLLSKSGQNIPGWLAKSLETVS